MLLNYTTEGWLIESDDNSDGQKLTKKLITNSLINLF